MGQPILIDWENFTNILMSHLDYKTSKKKNFKLLGQLILLEHFTNIYYSVTRCTNEVRFIRQKKKFDVALKFF